ncbi:hypothetical protein P4641_09115 [Halalkalibacterium halodurans]|uniref:hypothetical protein n=1 Tax=Halalkalibacterium halodurans TaxID=86665 RepID=UPI002E21C12A|nr:hypothetical protein [Halalkalibacterium halodurans]
MEINLLSTIITTIAAIFTIIQIAKEFIKPKSSALLIQENASGDNIYIDNSTSISTSTTINNPPFKNYKDYGFESNVLRVGLGLLVTSILLSIYSLMYEFISLICFIFLSINIYKDTTVPFENKQVKFQWVLQQITYVIIIFILSFIPKSVVEVIDQVPAFHFESFESLLDSLIFNVKFIWNLYYDSMLIAISVICRVLVSLGLIYYFVVSMVSKRKIHEAYNLNSSISFIIMILLIIIGSNVEYFWNLAEPLRHSIEMWFNTPQ